MSRLDEDRRKRLEERAVLAVASGHLDDAERLYRRLGYSLGLLSVAMHREAWERVASHALRWFRWWDTVPPAEQQKASVWGDYALVIRGIAIALDRMEGDAPRGEVARKRRARIVADCRKRLDAVADWPKVNRAVREFVRHAPEAFGPFASERLGRNLARERLGPAVDLLLEGNMHRAWRAIEAIRAATGQSPGDPFVVCPHCIEHLAEDSVEDARTLLPLLGDLEAATKAQKDAVELKSREDALMYGAEAVFYAVALARLGDPVDGLLARAEACLAAAPKLPTSGKAAGDRAGLLDAYLTIHRAKVEELRNRWDGALAMYERVAASDVEPWAERAADQAAHLRALRDAEARRRHALELRERWRAANAAGDAAAERAVLPDLLAVADEDALRERLAVLDVAAGGPGATDRAVDAVRRGSRDPALLAAIVGEGTRIASDRPGDAIELLRLAHRAGVLDPEASVAFASSLAAIGRWSEAGRAYEELAAADASRHLDAARAHAKAGEGRRALASVRALLASDVPASVARKAFALAATVAAPDVLGPIAEAALARDPGNADASALLDRLAVEEYRALVASVARDRSEGLAAFAKGDWGSAACALAAIPPEFRDEETARALARAYEGLGRVEAARDLYAALAPSREVLEGRARCAARLKRFAEARAAVRELLGIAEEGTALALGDDPDLLGILAEARGDLREAATRFEDEGLLRSLGEDARARGDAVAEHAALARLADRLPEPPPEILDRLAALDALVPVRAKGPHAGLPALVLCDTNVLLADLLEEGCPEGLNDLRRPPAAARMRELRASADVRLAVTGTVARELRAVLRYHAAVQAYEEDAQAVAAVQARAEALLASLEVARVARVAPRTTAEDVERVRAFYRPFRGTLRGLTERKARRAPGRSGAIRSRRTRGAGTALPEAADLRLLAEAAWIADAPVAGIGGVGLLSDDADFRAFRGEIERAFGVRVY